MADVFNTSLSVNIACRRVTDGDLVDPVDALSLIFSDALTIGTGADQANEKFEDTRTVGAASNDDLDIAGGVTNSMNQTTTFTRVKGLYLRNKSSSIALQVGGGSNPLASLFGAAGDIINVRPGGIILLWAPDATGYAVTAGTGDILRIANAGGASVDYDIVIIGTD